MDDDLEINADMFEEPEGFRPPPPPPTLYTYTRKSEAVTPGTPEKLELRLVGHHSLWAHHVWNASLYLGRYFDENKHLVAGKRCVLMPIIKLMSYFAPDKIQSARTRRCCCDSFYDLCI
eukprot:Colp12_sorted_trinity150504_noHs@27088